MVDACPVVISINGSCCEVQSNEFKFWLHHWNLIFTISQIFVEIVKQLLKDTAMLLLMKEDGRWFKGDKMAVSTSTEAG